MNAASRDDDSEFDTPRSVGSFGTRTSRRARAILATTTAVLICLALGAIAENRGGATVTQATTDTQAGSVAPPSSDDPIAYPGHPAVVVGELHPAAQTLEELYQTSPPEKALIATGIGQAIGASIEVQLAYPLPPNSVQIDTPGPLESADVQAVSPVYDLALMAADNALTSAIVTLPYDRSAVPSSRANDLRVAFQTISGNWKVESGNVEVRSESATVSLTTTHLGRAVVILEDPTDPRTWFDAIVPEIPTPEPAKATSCFTPDPCSVAFTSSTP
jgi:hypothetical protein